MIYTLDKSFIKNSIKANGYELRFKYNTNNDYFYFDLFDKSGQIIERHLKVVTGYDFGGFRIVSNDNHDLANLENISSFSVVFDG